MTRKQTRSKRCPCIPKGRKRRARDRADAAIRRLSLEGERGQQAQAASSSGGARGQRRVRRSLREDRDDPPLMAPPYRSLAQITRKAPHARRGCARIASIEPESGTPVLSSVGNPDLLCFSEVFSSESRFTGDGSSPSALG